jgi:hypothetical protein
MRTSAPRATPGRYFIADYDNPWFYQGNLLTTIRSGLEMRAQSVTLGDQYTFSPTIVNAFHGTFARLAINISTRMLWTSCWGVITSHLEVR